MMSLAFIPVEAQANDARAISAIKKLDKKDWQAASALVGAVNDPVLTKLYYWYFFQEDETGAYYAPLSNFIRTNPAWPRISTLKKQFEETMPDDMTNAQVAAWFADYPPKTAKGMKRYIDALLGQGQKSQASRILSDWWAETLLNPADQSYLYNRFGGLITRDASIRRLNTLLDAEYFTAGRAVADVLGADYAALTEARIALARQDNDVNQRIAAVPASLRNDSGLMFSRLKWRRMNNENEGAIEILDSAPAAKSLSNPKAWWQERHIMARRLIEQNDFRGAYRLVSQNRQTEGFPLAQAEFVAGWLALRFLNEPDKAKAHFEKLYNNVETPISKSRGAYWLGRAYQAKGQKQDAGNWFKQAARYQTTFYGQLAAAEIGLGSSLPSAAPPILSSQEVNNFNGDDLVKIASWMQQAGFEDKAQTFITAFLDAHDTPQAYRFAAEYAEKIGNVGAAVQVAKRASEDGMFLTAQGYPLMVNALGNIPVEWALVHGIIRQESVFNTRAISPAGARGLMQLMPGTASDVSRKLGIGYSQAALIDNPSYNIRLGSSYLDELVARFDGSYPLAIAGYNAGPGRVDKWLKMFGDPRKGEIDLIDWIELIPIYETRNYVQRVMEGIYAYRLRLKGIQPPPQAQIHVAMR